MTNQEELEMTVEGMTCLSCARHVEEALKSVSGVREASVPDGWESGRAAITADGDVSTEALEAAVREAGYSATVEGDHSNGEAATSSETEELELDIKGMTCASCAVHVEKALQSVPGVEEVQVSPWWLGIRAGKREGR